MSFTQVPVVRPAPKFASTPDVLTPPIFGSPDPIGVIEGALEDFRYSDRTYDAMQNGGDPISAEAEWIWDALVAAGCVFDAVPVGIAKRRSCTTWTLPGPMNGCSLTFAAITDTTAITSTTSGRKTVTPGCMTRPVCCSSAPRPTPGRTRIPGSPHYGACFDRRTMYRDRHGTPHTDSGKEPPTTCGESRRAYRGRE